MAKKPLSTKKVIISLLILLIGFSSYLSIRRNVVWGNSLKIWKEAVRVSPESSNAHYNLGLIYANSKQYDQAIEEYKTALKLNSSHAGSHTALGVAYSNKNLLKQALEHHKQAILKDPDLAEAYNNLGLVLLKMFRFNEAISAFKNAIDLKPSFIEAHNNLGVAHKKTGKIKEALEAYQRAIDLAPKNTVSYNNVGSLYAEMGDLKEARYWFGKALLISQTDKGARLAAYNLIRASKLGTDNIFLMENHNASYQFWKKKSVKDEILVHIDGHIDLAPIEENALKQISKIDITDLIASPYEIGKRNKPLTVENFIYPAIKDKMVRELWWVVPDRDLNANLIAPYKAYLEETLKTKIPNLSFKNGIIKTEGEIFGIPIYICRLKDLPSFKEQILLDIDTDYFTTDNALNHKVLGLAHITPEGFVNTLKKKNISSKLITISYSVEGGYTPLRYRYLAEFLLLLLQDIPIDRELLRLNDQAVASLAKGRYKKAISVYKKALSLNPDNPSLYYGLSLCCEGLDMDEKSNIYFKKAVELDSFYNDALLYRASTSMINGSFKEAGELFERFSAINPESPYAGYINLQLGIIEEKKGDLKAAIGYYEKAKGFDSTLRATYNNLGNCYSKLKMYKEAILEYEGALEIDSTVSGIHYNLANCYVKIGLYSIAIKHYQEALRIEPTLKDAINNLKYVQDMLKNQN